MEIGKISLLLIFLTLKIYATDIIVRNTPPMGYLSGCSLNKEFIDNFISNGFLSKGYKYIILDKCWGTKTNGEPTFIDSNFPDGFSDVINYLHKKNLLFGLSIDSNLGYQNGDINIYSSWGVDLIFFESTNPNDYEALKNELNDNRIFYSIGKLNEKEPTWAKNIANTWRTTENNPDDFNSVIEIIKINDKWYEIISQGKYNDPGLLNTQLSLTEFKTQFGLWAICKAPLIIGNHLNTINDDIKYILSNKEVIKINQDNLPKQGHLIKITEFEIPSDTLSMRGPPMKILECSNDMIKQKWYYKNRLFKNNNENLCLDAYYTPNNEPRQIGTYTCNSDSNQKWEINSNQIKSKWDSNKCLDKSLFLVECDSTDENQKWEYDSNNHLLKMNGKCLSSATEWIEIDTWFVELSHGNFAILFINLGPQSKDVGISWEELGFIQIPIKLRDLWNHNYLENFEEGIFINNLESHDCIFLKIIFFEEEEEEEKQEEEEEKVKEIEIEIEKEEKIEKEIEIEIEKKEKIEKEKEIEIEKEPEKEKEFEKKIEIEIEIAKEVEKEKDEVQEPLPIFIINLINTEFCHKNSSLIISGYFRENTIESISFNLTIKEPEGTLLICNLIDYTIGCKVDKEINNKKIIIEETIIKKDFKEIFVIKGYQTPNLVICKDEINKETTNIKNEIYFIFKQCNHLEKLNNGYSFKLDILTNKEFNKGYILNLNMNVDIDDIPTEKNFICVLENDISPIDFNLTEGNFKCTLELPEEEFKKVNYEKIIISPNNNEIDGVSDLDEITRNPYKCTIDEIINNECKDKEITLEQMGQIKEKLLNEKYNGENTIIETESVIIQLSKLDNQTKQENPYISNINLGECEDILRETNNITEDEDLIIYKTDIKTSDSSSRYVTYEIYDSNLNKLNLDVCSDVQISIEIPVDFEDSFEDLVKSMSDSGYNIFNENDSFYNDICSTFTNPDGVDMLISDRKKDIYTVAHNMSICQTGCEIESYNVTSKKAKCNCEISSSSSTITSLKVDNLFSKKGIANNFYDTLANSNFLVMKCYNLLLDFSNFFKNYGEIIMTVLIILLVIMMIIYIILGNRRIKYFLVKIMKMNWKHKINKNVKFKKDNFDEESNAESENKQMKLNSENVKKKSKKKIKNGLNNVEVPPKKERKRKNCQSVPGSIEKKKRIKVNSIKNNFEQNRSETVGNLIRNKKIKSKIKDENIDNKIENKYDNKKSKFETGGDINNNSLENNNHKIIKFTDTELDDLDFEKAIIYDNRTYLQYYWSILKQSQLILFTFFPIEDYNLVYAKIALFIISFGLFFTINGFFFSDDTMHKVYEDKGEFDIIYQIPQIFYSSIISNLFNVILKNLSLSNSDISGLKLEERKNLSEEKKRAKQIYNCLRIKLILFFIISFILMLFFWYFISCFCAVYKNTQMILIKDTGFSFGSSLLYPFLLSFIPGIFRIPALRLKKKCLYRLSLIVNWFL